MGTTIRARISKKNRYHIDKHRHYELKHFCLQYPAWKKAYADTLDLCISTSNLDRAPSTNGHSDPTSKYAVMKTYYSERINLVEQTALAADSSLYLYILKAVTEGLSYTYLKSKLDIPCGKDMFYDRYRRFFWLLSESRN